MADTEMVEIPRDDVRELVKWAYAAAYFDDYTTVEHLRDVTRSTPGLLDEIISAREILDETGWKTGFDEI